MPPKLADSLAITFYFFFWGAIFSMIEWSFANVFQTTYFNWLVVIACATFFSYFTVWFSKYGG